MGGTTWNVVELACRAASSRFTACHAQAPHARKDSLRRSKPSATVAPNDALKMRTEDEEIVIPNSEDDEEPGMDDTNSVRDALVGCTPECF